MLSTNLYIFVIKSFFQINQQSPEGAEIKIPGVGSTPIAISTQLPAAVAQLSKKGEFLHSVLFCYETNKIYLRASYKLHKLYTYKT